MNILFFTGFYLNYGGVEVVTSVLAKKFTKDGHIVTIASLELPHPTLTSQLIDGAEIIRLNKPILSRSNKKILHHLIVEKKIDIIINQWGLNFLTTILLNCALKGTNCKLVSVLHGAPNISKIILSAQDKVNGASNSVKRVAYASLLKMKESVVKWSIRYACKHNEKYILLSSSFIQPLINYAKIKKTSNILAIGNPITIPMELSDFKLENKKNQLLYVGRMDYENKRVNRIVEAWEKLYNKYDDWSLVLVGDGSHKQNLVNYVKEHHIKNVFFEKFQIEPPIKYYKEASIFLLTSDLEGFGLVITESMIYGCIPIVYGSYEAVYDIIESGISGFITPKPYSKEETIKYIEYLINNKEERQRMAVNAMKRAKQFSLESIVTKWYEIIYEVVKKE